MGLAEKVIPYGLSNAYQQRYGVPLPRALREAYELLWLALHEGVVSGEEEKVIKRGKRASESTDFIADFRLWRVKQDVDKVLARASAALAQWSKREKADGQLPDRHRRGDLRSTRGNRDQPADAPEEEIMRWEDEGGR